jgi:hypothetical protein
MAELWLNSQCFMTKPHENHRSQSSNCHFIPTSLWCHVKPPSPIKNHLLSESKLIFFMVKSPNFSEHFLVEVVHGIHAMLVHVMLHDALVAPADDWENSLIKNRLKMMD